MIDEPLFEQPAHQVRVDHAGADLNEALILIDELALGELAHEP